MQTENTEFKVNHAVLNQALDDALAVFSEAANIRPISGMLALLDGIVERCTELQPEATEQLLRIQLGTSKRMFVSPQ